ncbi:MAG: glycogen synthase [Syntrophobacterales bacterium]|jgi:starch synthase|nr:glycogen synthase [Syntrophobacterales bacterium]
MFILMVTPEASPFAQAGNLAEVMYGLCRALVRSGDRVAVVIPLYQQVHQSGWPISFTGRTISVPLSYKALDAEIFHAPLEPGLDFYFIRQDSFFDRDGLYGNCYGDFQDNAERFIFFSRAVAEMVEALEMDIDVCHCHEWQTGLVPVYGRTRYRERPRWQHLPVVYSVHNAGFQGIFPAYDFPLTGLEWELLSAQALEFYGKLNFMKGGLVFADLLSTVSSRYREEILTPAYGCGLEGIFHERAADLVGIGEGVDYSRWDPAQDAYLASGYSRNHLAGKQACKQQLVTRFGLDPQPTLPLIGMTTRLCERKGIDLVEAILEDLLRLEVSFILQGTGEERHKYCLQEVAARYPNRMGLSFGYSEALAHQIIAGSDIFLMPSRYEPGGLDQLHCLRYGTVPVVRATGGLDETIQEYHPETGQGNGFKFSDYTAEAFKSAVYRAVTLFHNKAGWEAVIKDNMALDYSWESVIPQYQDLYRRALEKRRGPRRVSEYDLEN